MLIKDKIYFIFISSKQQIEIVPLCSQTLVEATSSLSKGALYQYKVYGLNIFILSPLWPSGLHQSGQLLGGGGVWWGALDQRGRYFIDVL